MSKGGKRNKISYVQQSEPSFITKFKEKVSYKEGPTVDTKRERLEEDCDDDEEREDEAPMIVVLKDGDLSSEQVNALKSEEKEEVPADGKIVFKKPTKRIVEEDETKNEEIKKKKKDKGVKNTKLLSFGDDEEED